MAVLLRASAEYNLSSFLDSTIRDLGDVGAQVGSRSKAMVQNLGDEDPKKQKQYL